MKWNLNKIGWHDVSTFGRYRTDWRHTIVKVGKEGERRWLSLRNSNNDVKFIRSFKIGSRFHGLSRYAVFRSTSNITIVSSVTRDVIETYTNLWTNRLQANVITVNYSDHLSESYWSFDTSRFYLNNSQISTVVSSYFSIFYIGSRLCFR